MIRLQERRERHRQNYMHVTIHTSQTWADTFISELNDTHVEAELRTKHIPPQVRRLLLHCSCNVEFLGVANALSWLARLMTVHQISLLSSGLYRSARLV